MRALLAAAALALFGSSAGAAVIDSSDGLIDSDTGLEWLDVTVNENLSYNTMIGSNLNGYGSQGYRYATVFEVGTLFENAGAILPALGATQTDPADFAVGDLLISYLGSNSNYSSYSYIQAVTGTNAPNGGQYAPWIRGTATSGSITLSFGEYQPSDSFAGSTVGHWLVRETTVVPLPASLPLLLAGLGGLGLVARRRARSA
ncbi:VPLPA-CTERM sorting domain-containing protein [Roseovarius sp. A21]|uniref:VPLPA-CTERM sorting domain-containing protein n=1 Tax=Roseovarius bejariae TaxID=2576383 RepID=A0A844CH12_9RHOB|nr:VPLPA-CTERM sorting domain-containing protein [Roseovarius bejariae]MRU13917.1 VPLPA-CTERM sorting domain-containing protein [Roseovarius bejariae]